MNYFEFYWHCHNKFTYIINWKPEIIIELHMKTEVKSYNDYYVSNLSQTHIGAFEFNH